jgi:cortexillin 1/2
MAFLALVHRFNPDKTKVEFNSHSPADLERNLSVAFELAEQELGIPKLLDVKEVMTGHVDERSLVLYTSLFFHAYKAAAVCFLPSFPLVKF